MDTSTDLSTGRRPDAPRVTGAADDRLDPTRLGRAAAQRLRRPGPRLGRPRPPLIGSLASSSVRFAHGWGRPVEVRRALAGPATDVTPRRAPQEVSPPRWWSQVAPLRAEQASHEQAAAVPRGLPRMVDAIPAERRPGSVRDRLAPQTVRVRVTPDVTSAGRMVSSADDARPRSASRVAARPPGGTQPGNAPGSGPSSSSAAAAGPAARTPSVATTASTSPTTASGATPPVRRSPLGTHAVPVPTSAPVGSPAPGPAVGATPAAAPSPGAPVLRPAGRFVRRRARAAAVADARAARSTSPAAPSVPAVAGVRSTAATTSTGSPAVPPTTTPSTTGRTTAAHSSAPVPVTAVPPTSTPSTAADSPAHAAGEPRTAPGEAAAPRGLAGPVRRFLGARDAAPAAALARALSRTSTPDPAVVGPSGTAAADTAPAPDRSAPRPSPSASVGATTLGTPASPRPAAPSTPHAPPAAAVRLPGGGHRRSGHRPTWRDDPRRGLGLEPLTLRRATRWSGGFAGRTAPVAAPVVRRSPDPAPPAASALRGLPADAAPAALRRSVTGRSVTTRPAPASSSAARPAAAVAAVGTGSVGAVTPASGAVLPAPRGHATSGTSPVGSPRSGADGAPRAAVPTSSPTSSPTGDPTTSTTSSASTTAAAVAGAPVRRSSASAVDRAPVSDGAAAVDWSAVGRPAAWESSARGVGHRGPGHAVAMLAPVPVRPATAGAGDSRTPGPTGVPSSGPASGTSSGTAAARTTSPAPRAQHGTTRASGTHTTGTRAIGTAAPTIRRWTGAAAWRASTAALPPAAAPASGPVRPGAPSAGAASSGAASSGALTRSSASGATAAVRRSAVTSAGASVARSSAPSAGPLAPASPVGRAGGLSAADLSGAGSSGAGLSAAALAAEALATSPLAARPLGGALPGAGAPPASPPMTPRSATGTASGAVPASWAVLPPRTVVRRSPVDAPSAPRSWTRATPSGSRSSDLAPGGLRVPPTIPSGPSAPSLPPSVTPGSSAWTTARPRGRGNVTIGQRPTTPGGPVDVTSLPEPTISDETIAGIARTVEDRMVARLEKWRREELDDHVLRLVERRLEEETERRSWRRGTEVF